MSQSEQERYYKRMNAEYDQEVMDQFVAAMNDRLYNHTQALFYEGGLESIKREKDPEYARQVMDQRNQELRDRNRTASEVLKELRDALGS